MSKSCAYPYLMQDIEQLKERIRNNKMYIVNLYEHNEELCDLLKTASSNDAINLIPKIQRNTTEIELTTQHNEDCESLLSELELCTNNDTLLHNLLERLDFGWMMDIKSPLLILTNKKFTLFKNFGVYSNLD